MRGVAQLVSVPALGAGGRQFESDHPDKAKTCPQNAAGFIFSARRKLAFRSKRKN
jgi:hypothetical protein